MSNHINGVKSGPKWGEPFLNCSVDPGVKKPKEARKTFPRRAGGEGLHTSVSATSPDSGAHFQRGPSYRLENRSSYPCRESHLNFGMGMPEPTPGW